MGEYGNGWPVPITHNGEGMNMAQWVSTYENWANQMAAQGFNYDDLPAMVAAAGETYPKSLIATFHARNSLGPTASMLYQNDYDNWQRRSVPHINADYPGGTGYGEWQDISAEDKAGAQSYYAWKEDPNNYGLIEKFGGNPYNAFVASQHGQGGPRGASAYHPNSGPAVQGQNPRASGIPGYQTLGQILGQHPPETHDLTSKTTTGVDPYAATSTLGGLMGTEDWKKKYELQGGASGTV